MIRTFIALASLSLLALAPAACAPAAAPAQCATSGLTRVGGPLSLLDEAGRPVTQAVFAGKPTLVYFGYASCPDVCPAALQTLARALEARKGRGPLETLLVSVDPQRDTPEKLQAYVHSGSFPQGLRGFTGSTEQIDAAKTAFKVYASRRDTPGSAMGYVMDHTSLFYLMDGSWRTQAVFPSSLAPDGMAACIDSALAK